MNLALLKHKIRYGSFFIPFNLLLILLITALFLSYKWLINNNALPETSYTAIITLFIKVVIAFAGGIIILAFVSAAIPWTIFMLNRRKKNVQFSLKTVAQQKSISNDQQVMVNLKPVYKPVSGFIKLRIKYDEGKFSQKFSLANLGQKKSFFSSALSGIYNWTLPEIKEYNVSETVIYFEDMFQLFSFAAAVPAQDNFYTKPQNLETEPVKVHPKKTEDTQVRIENIRKVQGEYLNYKNFENNDDVRRIVWKIYAKNGELVVRIPETNDPYASHVYVYASFFNSLSSGVYQEFNSFFLNYFKTAAWNVYLQLSKQDVMLKYIPDQPAPASFTEDEVEKVKYILSTADWQKNNEPVNYVKNDASVICISSFTDAGQLEQITEKLSREVLIVFVQLSNAFRATNVKDWLQWIFIAPQSQTAEQLKIVWNISPLKQKVLANEERIMQILNGSDVEKLIL